jgi:hypothetical protein
MFLYRYNRYLAVAARVVRRSLKEDKRIAAETRGHSELRFAKWEVRKKLEHEALVSVVCLDWLTSCVDRTESRERTRVLKQQT